MLDELANAVTEAEAKAPEDLTEHDKMALLGRPKSGDIVRAQLRIKESKEFKVSLQNKEDENRNRSRRGRVERRKQKKKKKKRKYIHVFHFIAKRRF